MLLRFRKSFRSAGRFTKTSLSMNKHKVNGNFVSNDRGIETLLELFVNKR